MPSSSASRPTKGRATPASRAQSQRPLGARSFAKLALFEQADDGNDLRPIPREQPPNQRWSSDEEVCVFSLFVFTHMLFLVFPPCLPKKVSEVASSVSTLTEPLGCLHCSTPIFGICLDSHMLFHSFCSFAHCLQ